MSAAELRQAATTLRERAIAATRPDEMHPWGDESLPSLPPEMHPNEVNAALGGTWGTYYATMHPGVGLALADWLDRAAEKRAGGEDLLGTSRFSTDDDRAPIALARLINGGAS